MPVWSLLALALGAASPSELTLALQHALAQEAAGDEPGALRELDGLVHRAPTWELPRMESARLLLKRGERLELAQAHLEAARSLAPENPRAHYLWALWLEEEHRPAQAIAALGVALVLRPEFDEASFRLGALLLSQGDAAGAVVAYRRALKRHPEATGSRLQLALALERSGHVAEAEHELSLLAQASATRQVGTAKLADLYARTGREAKAQKLRASLGAPERKLRPLLPSRR
ncbi:MAG: tetratricopeptide repeat protein [Myxococcaceae bacterium]|nr:tetratricopeptide repeat protein [Myxococcaceae bacterium]